MKPGFPKQQEKRVKGSYFVPLHFVATERIFLRVFTITLSLCPRFAPLSLPLSGYLDKYNSALRGNLFLRPRFQHMEMVTLMPRFPLSAKSCAMEVSKTRQSEFMMADETPSWMERGVASQVRRRRWPFSSSLAGGK